MEYRKLGKTGLDVGAIGLGMEHLAPLRENIGPVVHRAIDRGVNYFDIMIWAPEAMSVFGAALKGRRDKILLAGHLGVAETDGQYRKTRDVEECEALFHDLLSRLGTDHVDVLHVSNVDQEDDYDRIVSSGGSLELALRLKREGKARFLGLSGHTAAIAVRAVESGHFDLLMQSINVGGGGLDPEGTRVAHLCASRGTGLVVMKAFAGGELFQRENPVPPVRCISYVLSLPGVSTALVGVKNLRELEEDLAFLDATEEERDFTSHLKGSERDMQGKCVYCNHCLPCPSGIDIATLIRLLVTAQYGVTDQVRADYDALPLRASECTECGECVERCPFGVDIIARLREAVEVFEAEAGQ